MTQRTTADAMQRPFLLLLAALLLLWAISLPPGDWAEMASFWKLRSALIPGTGYLAMGCMSLAMILAARPARLEKWLGGLDQFYRLHRKLGIAGMMLALLHWLLEIIPRWMVGQGWLTRPQRGGARGEPPPFAQWRDSAAELGEWALYLMLALVLVALWKRIPYRYFAKLHRLIPVAYLVLVYHSVVFMPERFWSVVGGPVMALLMAGGVVAAVLSLAGMIGFQRRALGHVQSLRHHADHVLEVHCQLETPWAGHESGQFVFATFHRDEGAHPFTVVSRWAGDGHLVLAIKELGDYTRTLPQRLAPGDPVTIEGPYGRFNFEGERERQIWVAGGIGITPFLSRMELLAQGGAGRRPVDLFFSTDEATEPLMTILRELAEKSGVRLHVVVPPRDGYLTIDGISAAAPNPEQAEVWFCGPTGFGDAVRSALMQRGLPARYFHQESFQMR